MHNGGVSMLTLDNCVLSKRSIVLEQVHHVIKHQSHHYGHIQYLRLLPVNEEENACIHLIHSNELLG